MEIAFHLVSKKYFDSVDANSEYLPADFAEDGFIHCTDDPEEMARVANLFYRDEPPPHLYLYIDKARVRAPIRYDDAARLYPHIYGRLNRDAIVALREARRDTNGIFLPPESMDESA